MIEKRQSSAQGILYAKEKAVKKACSLENGLMNAAFKASLYPRFGTLYAYEILDSFRILEIRGRTPSQQVCEMFVEASTRGYRVESSLMSDNQMTLDPVGMPLVLMVKFYHKEDPEEHSPLAYFSLTIIFDDNGNINSWKIDF